MYSMMFFFYSMEFSSYNLDIINIARGICICEINATKEHWELYRTNFRTIVLTLHKRNSRERERERVINSESKLYKK